MIKCVCNNGTWIAKYAGEVTKRIGKNPIHTCVDKYQYRWRKDKISFLNFVHLVPAVSVLIVSGLAS